MKRTLLALVCVISACGADEPQNASNNSNNATNNSTTVTSNNVMNNRTNNSNTNSMNNTSNNATNNSTNTSTNNQAIDMGGDAAVDSGADMEMDMGVDVALDLGPGPDGDLCATAIPIAAGQTFDNQTTVGASDDYSARGQDDDCPNNPASGRDRVYVFNPLADGNYRVLVVPEASFDPAIYVRLDCAAAACLTGTILNGQGVQESVTFDAVANTDYFLIVDGELGDSGAYSISVQAM